MHTREDEGMTIQTELVVDDVNLKAQYNQFDERAPWKGGMHKVAEIPLPLFFEMNRKTGGDFARNPKLVRAWVNDPDNKVFRTRPGRI